MCNISLFSFPHSFISSFFLFFQFQQTKLYVNLNAPYMCMQARARAHTQREREREREREGSTYMLNWKIKVSIIQIANSFNVKGR
jgi:hypothetical protein